MPTASYAAGSRWFLAGENAGFGRVPLGAVLLTALFATLPSCVTQALWGLDDNGDDDRYRVEHGGTPARFRTEWLGEDIGHDEGELEVVGDGLLMRGADGEGLWRLVPGPRAPDAVALLGCCGALIERVSAEIAYDSIWCDGERFSERTLLGLSVSLPRAMLAAEVDLAAVPGPTRVALTESAVDPFQAMAASWSPLRATAARRLTPAVLQRMLALSEEPTVLFATYVDSQLAPFAAAAAAGGGGGGGEGRERRLDAAIDTSAVLAELQRSPLLVQLRVAGRRKLFRIDMARAWIYTMLAPQGSRLIHRSNWDLVPVAKRSRAIPHHASLGGSLGGSLCVPATCQRKQHMYRYVEIKAARRGGSDSDFWGRLALTPLTLLIDCALSPLYACGKLLFDEEDDEECDRPDTVHDPAWRRRAKRR
ncbi:MAG: hypothetical protein AB8H80_18100 [Planctomycetota bacterium]